jgi:DNA-binding MarR family transcriptional regulator
VEYTAKNVDNLSDEEKLILNIIKQDGETHLEKIAVALNKKTFQIVQLCSALEIKGFIVRAGGNKYAAVK